jgi:hypothetical protein
VTPGLAQAWAAFSGDAATSADNAGGGRARYRVFTRAAAVALSAPAEFAAAAGIEVAKAPLPTL